MNRKMDIIEEQVLDTLREILDPEFLINIVDLGLVYDVRVDERDQQINIDITFTTSSCPLIDTVVGDITELLQTKHSRMEIRVNVVWSPPWSTSMITKRGLTELGNLNH